MPASLDPGDRKILIAAAIALAVLLAGALLLSAPQSRSVGFPSSYSPASDGAKAAYLLLDDLGYDVQRWESSPVELPLNPANHVLILAEPWMGISSAETQALRRFVRGGGCVLVTGALGARLMPEGKTTPVEDDLFEWQTLHATLPSQFTRFAPEISMETPVRWSGSGAQQLGLYSKDRAEFVVTYRSGMGRVVWWAGATPLTNAGISKSNNLAFFLNAMGDPGHTKILWDEYLHGETGSLWAYVAATPVPWGLLQLGVVAAALLFTFSRRSGPVRPATVESRLSPLEFVDTLGALYHHGHAAPEAVRVIYQRFRFLLLRRLGLPRDASIEQLQRSVREKLGWNQPGFFETLQAAERAARDDSLSDADALAIVQALEHYSRLFQLHLARPSQEKN